MANAIDADNKMTYVPGSYAADAGLVVSTDAHAVSARSAGDEGVDNAGLRICIESLSSDFSSDLNSGESMYVLTADVYHPGHRRPDQIEIGLVGNGLSAATILDSIRPDHSDE